MKNVKIAIVGGSGLVGEKIIRILFEERVNVSEIRLFVSKKSAGKSIILGGKEFRFELLTEKAAEQKFDIVFFSAGDEISKIWAEKFAKHGAYVIDNSNAFRREQNIPLVVPEINGDRILKTTKIIANPNCSTIQLAMVLKSLSKLSQIEKVVVSTYQSVSGAGKEALLDLYNHTNNEIPEMICGNVIEKIGRIEENGFCTEENKIMFEINKILESDYSVCASTVRVPIPFCHTESVYVKFRGNVSVLDAENSLKADKIIIDDILSLPADIADTNLVHVCRIRQFSKDELALFVVADNLRRGAAYNAVLIAKIIINKFL